MDWKKVAWIEARPLEHGEYVADWSDLQEPAGKWPDEIRLEEFRKWHELCGVEFTFWKDEYNDDEELVAKWYRTCPRPDGKNRQGKWAKRWTLRVLNDAPSGPMT